MRKEDKIRINCIDITVKELTVGEVRHWMMDMVEQEKQKDKGLTEIAAHVVDQGFLKEVALSDICRMTDLTMSQLDQFTPSELELIVEKCKVLNPDFFSLRSRTLGSAIKTPSLD